MTLFRRIYLETASSTAVVSSTILLVLKIFIEDTQSTRVAAYNILLWIMLPNYRLLHILPFSRVCQIEGIMSCEEEKRLGQKIKMKKYGT
jgi:hypothetical protein